MPYSSVKEVPDYVPSASRKQWLEVFNSAHAKAKEDGKSDADAEASAFAQANAVAGPNAKLLSADVVKLMPLNYFKGDKFSQLAVGYETVSTRPGKTCGGCHNFEPPDGCSGVAGPIAATGWCLRFDPDGRGVGNKAAFAGRKAMTGRFEKFIPFAKVDAAKREVWGIVTAEVPDKDDEVCDYFKSKPYYEAIIAEMSKATDGKNFMPLRYMHQNEAVGKGIGYELRDDDREIFMGFKVVDDDTWKLVDENVLTGFSHGGKIMGDLVPDPVYKNCMRYVANPAEVSLVDNPCLGIAHFTYVSKAGETTLRKNRSTATPVVSVEKFEALVKDFNDLRKSVGLIQVSGKTVSEVKTRKVDGEELPPSAFIFAKDLKRPETWQLPVTFADAGKTKAYLRAAIVKLPGLKDLSEGDRRGGEATLSGLAKAAGLDVAVERTRFAKVREHLRRGMRKRVNQLARTQGDPGHALTFVDDDLGRLAKGMWEVGCLAQNVNCITNLLYNVISEQEWERDTDSVLPGMLEDSVNGLLDALVAMVAEESRELREELAARG